MSKELVLTESETKSFSEAIAFANKWCSENQWAVGVGEMAIGAGLIAWGVHNGIIDMGSQLVATQIGGTNIEAIAGAAGGSGLGAIAGSILGSIGVVGMGGAVGIPAAIVIGGAAAIFGFAGYTAGDVLHNITTQSIDVSSLVENGSVLMVGVALVIHGAIKCINDDKVSSMLSAVKENIIILKNISVEIIANNFSELKEYIKSLGDKPENFISTGVAGVGAGVGASIGTGIAASSVTILGSQSLGGLALSMGLVSAPLWPVIAGVTGGAGIGYAIYKAVKYWNNDTEESS